MTSKPAFESREAYQANGDGYRLLPFQFMRYDCQRQILVNEVGQYHILENATFQAFVQRRLESSDETFKALKAKHFLYDSEQARITAIDLLATKYRTKKSFLTGFTKLHIFVVSLRCDHSCPYCQVSRVSMDREKYDMSRDTAEKAIQVMFRSPAEALKVEFQGGESLLNFELIAWMVERIEELNKQHQRHIEFVIASNLSPLTEAMLVFFNAHNVHLSTSLDGPEHLHNANRPRPGTNSHQKAIKGIEMARAVLGHDRVSALMTTTKQSLSYPIEIIDEYRARGFRSIFLRSISPYGFATLTARKTGYEMAEFLDFYKTALNYIIELNKHGKFFVEEYARIILTKILTPFATGYVDLQSPTGLGIGVVVYNYDGDVYTSDESRMLAEMGDKQFRLGTVNDSYEVLFASKRLQSIVVHSCVESLPGCSDCAFQSYCGSDPVYNYSVQGSVVGHRPTSDFCTKNMAIIRHLIELIESDEAVRRIFVSWGTGVPSPVADGQLAAV